MPRSVGVLFGRPPARCLLNKVSCRSLARGGLARDRRSDLEDNFLTSMEEIEALLSKGGATPLAERHRTAAKLLKAAAPWTAAPHGEPEMSVEPGGSTPTQQWWTLSIPTNSTGDEAVIVSRLSSVYTPEVVGGDAARPPTGLVQGLWVHEALPCEVSVPLIRAVVDDLRVGGCETSRSMVRTPLAHGFPCGTDNPPPLQRPTH